jgi:diadenosine tetraphosphate (Ap4A) HIT family hydrolase
LQDSPDTAAIRCDFCDEFSSGQQNAYARRYGLRPASRILLDGPFRVLPTLGQIAEGHLLIVPVPHLCAVADLPNGSLGELENLCQQVRSVLRGEYGECVFFEHGMREAGSGGCGIDHAHIHAVPVRADGVLDILMQEFQGSNVHSLVDMKTGLDQNSSYLFFEDASSQRHVFPVKHLPSQYMRKLVAESIGKSDWDWRKFGHEPELISTVQRLAPLFYAVGSPQRG